MRTSSENFFIVLYLCLSMALRSNILVFCFLLFILLLIPTAGAVSETVNITQASIFNASSNSSNSSSSSNTENAFFTELSEQVTLYNENFDTVPGIFKRLVGSEEIALKIEQSNGEMLYATALMRGGKVGDFYSYETANDPNSMFGPTITVETDEETIRTILDSENPLKEAVTSMNEGNLDVECDSFFRKAVLWSIKQLYA